MTSTQSPSYLDQLNAFVAREYGPNAPIATLVMLAALTRRFSLTIDAVSRADAVELVESILRRVPEVALARTTERYPNTYMANDPIEVVLEDAEHTPRAYLKFRQQMLQHGSAKVQVLNERQRVRTFARNGPIAFLMFASRQRARGIDPAQSLVVKMSECSDYHAARVMEQLQVWTGSGCLMSESLGSHAKQVRQIDGCTEPSLGVNIRSLQPGYMDGAVRRCLKHIVDVAAAITFYESAGRSLTIGRNHILRAFELLEEAGATVDQVSLSRYAESFIAQLPALIASIEKHAVGDRELRQPGVFTIPELLVECNRHVFSQAAHTFSDSSKRHPKTSGAPAATRSVIAGRLSELVELGLLDKFRIKGKYFFRLTEQGHLYSKAASLNGYQILKSHFEAFNRDSTTN